MRGSSAVRAPRLYSSDEQGRRHEGQCLADFWVLISIFWTERIPKNRRLGLILCARIPSPRSRPHTFLSLRRKQPLQSSDSRLRSPRSRYRATTSPTTLENYRAEYVVPPLPDNLFLDFSSQDESGEFCAPEGHLKSKVLKSASSNRVIAARGVGRPEIVHGASGMAGVGKTMSLIALGHDKDLRHHFRDGILYLSLGADATVESITRGLYKIMKLTGATTSADAVRNQTDLTAAIEDAALWFFGKCNLFLLDDVWRTNSNANGFLPELRNILEGSPDSRLVLATRNVLIGSSVGSHVDFDARDPLGPTSTSMFMGYASSGCRTDVDE